jgi:hypothetical protein
LVLIKQAYRGCKETEEPEVEKAGLKKAGLNKTLQ